MFSCLWFPSIFSFVGRSYSVFLTLHTDQHSKVLVIIDLWIILREILYLSSFNLSFLDANFSQKIFNEPNQIFFVNREKI